MANLRAPRPDCLPAQVIQSNLPVISSLRNVAHPRSLTNSIKGIVPKQQRWDLSATDTIY